MNPDTTPHTSPNLYRPLGKDNTSMAFLYTYQFHKSPHESLTHEPIY